MMPAPKILVLFGSETGTAQDVAECIWRDSKRLGFVGDVLPMDEYTISNLIYEPLIIFVCSTTGQGDPPENMRKFWKFLLRKNLPSNSLANSRVAVLGLGDSSYPKFNFAAKKLSRRLTGLGAVQLLETGLCDDQHDLGHDAVVGPWTAQLWETLRQHYPAIDTHSLDNKTLIIRWMVEEAEGTSDPLDFPPGDPKERIWAKVTENSRTTPPQHFQEVRLVSLEPETPVCYSPGAVLLLRPRSPPSSVSHLLSLLADKAHTSFRLRSRHLPLPPVLDNKVLSLAQLASTYWDLNMVPGRYVFEVLAAVTTSELEREKLEEFISPGGLEELYTYCNRPRRTIVEVLSDFPSATAALQIEHLFEIFQPIRARPYSIASSLEHDGQKMKLLVAVVDYKTRLVARRIGLCTAWLASLSPGQRISVALRSPTLRFPDCSPVLLVGPGTGVAPFRSYLSQEVALRRSGGGDYRSSRDLILIFGARNKEADFHFGRDLECWSQSNYITLFTAFSRDQPYKIYVQDIIAREGSFIFEAILSRGGTIFVAGSSKEMPAGVRLAFLRVLTEVGGLTDQEAEASLSKMETSGRYQVETW